MRYHDITTDDMKNGDGLRVVLWVAGCNHHCFHCQNPITWDPTDGLVFGVEERNSIFTQLSKDYISGITFSGGDPLHPSNREQVAALISAINHLYQDKTIWIYTGYTWQEILNDIQLLTIVSGADILVDGRYVQGLSDKNYHWAGSTNQRVIDIKHSLQCGKVVLYESN